MAAWSLPKEILFDSYSVQDMTAGCKVKRNDVDLNLPRGKHELIRLVFPHPLECTIQTWGKGKLSSLVVKSCLKPEFKCDGGQIFSRKQSTKTSDLNQDYSSELSWNYANILCVQLSVRRWRSCSKNHTILTFKAQSNNTHFHANYIGSIQFSLFLTFKLSLSCPRVKYALIYHWLKQTERHSSIIMLRYCSNGCAKQRKVFL